MLLFSLLCLIPKILALQSWLGLPSQLPLQSHHDYVPFSDDFERFVDATLSEFLTPGLAIAIVHGNSTFAKGYGLANIASKEPVTPRTLFFTGSTTKSFTAAAASKLVYSNETAHTKISWQSKLVDLIRDDFVLEDEYATNHITFIDALSHRTGMPRHDLSWINGDPTVREQVRQLRYLPPREMRSQWEYCNLMFTAVSHTIEIVTGTAMATLLREWIWEPLGMHETFYDLADALALAEKNDEVSMATGYLYDNYTKVHVPVPFSDIPPSNGAGGVLSTALDYTKWIKLFLHPTNSCNPITPAAIKAMTTAHMPIPASSRPVTGTDFYGLGLQGSVYRGYETIGHDGAINGYMTSMLWVPKLDWGVAIMQNAYSLAAEIVLWRLLDDFLQTPDNETFDMSSIARQEQATKLQRLENARQTLYPDANGDVVAPALPLQAYEGVYHHPAYQSLRLSISEQPDHAETSGINSALPPLLGLPAAKNYMNISITLKHVSGEYWWGRTRYGPGSFLADDMKKAKFEVGVDGKVKGLGLQAEPAMDELAWFEKVE
ncbi:hypothetical protein LTR08_000351 [Meristemomyces frigidus]|nr:hypothetical protein LTR08_000351 [Meristemomyces frigidus]